MYVDGFDGLDFVVLTVPNADPLVGLYGDLLGFTVASDTSPAPVGATDLLGVSTEVTRIVHLRRGADAGGDIMLVETPALPPEPQRVPQRQAGVYALDFYLRDAAATERAIADAGWELVSEAVHYDLPGTAIPVRERMLVQHHSGLLHALVQHRPGGTRSVLGTDAGSCSEVVAVVVLTADLPGARRFATEVLKGQEYFTGTFSGPAVEEMLGYAPGEGLEASLYRGPESRNARLEFARPVDSAGRPLALPPRPARRVQPGLLVDDLDALLARLASGEHGSVAAVEHVDWLGSQRRVARFDTVYDVSLVLADRAAVSR